MADSNSPKSGSHGSAANLMAEALDNSMAELDKTVKACIEQLNSFNENLEKSLTNQLQKVTEQASNFVESTTEDLTTRREDLVDRLTEFERTEIETVVSAARDVRQQVAARAQQANDSIARLVEEQLQELRQLVANPESRFSEFGQKSVEGIKNTAVESKDTIEDRGTELEKDLSAYGTNLDEAVQSVVENSKRGLDRKLDKHGAEFEQKIGQVIEKLTELVNETVSDLERQTNSAGKSIDASSETAQARLEEHVDDWKNDLKDLRTTFEAGLSKERTISERAHSTRLERKVREVKEEIDHIYEAANVKVSASQKLFQSSLKRLEKKYQDRLERLLSRFEAAIAQEASLSASPNSQILQTSHELREILHARLQARGAEIVKSFQRQMEQLETEFARSSIGSICANAYPSGIVTTFTIPLPLRIA